MEILGGEKQRAILFAPASFICGTGFCQTPQGRSIFSFFIVRHSPLILARQYG